MVGRIGVTRGICVVLEDSECRTAIRLAKRTELTILAQFSRGPDAAAACRAADAAGLYGTRIWVARGK